VTGLTIAIADAVAVALNGRTWSLEFIAARSYQPTHSLPDLATLKVSVVPSRVQNSLAARSSWEQVHTVEIGIQQRPETLTNETIDPLTRLAEEIAEWWQDNPSLVVAGRRLSLVAVDLNPIAYGDDLAERQLFTSVVALSFKGWR